MGAPSAQPTPGAFGAPALPGRWRAGEVARDGDAPARRLLRRRREKRVQCGCAKAGPARGGREAARRAPARGLRGAGARPGCAERVALRVGLSAALVSFAALGGAEAEAEEEVAAAAAESDAALFVGAPLACLFIYLSRVPPSARAPPLAGEGVGGGSQGKGGAGTRAEPPRDV